MSTPTPTPTPTGDSPPASGRFRFRRPSRQTLRWIERALLLIGILCLGSYAYAWLDTRLYERAQNQKLEEALARHSLPASSTRQPAPAPGSAPSQPSAQETDSFESFRSEEDGGERSLSPEERAELEAASTVYENLSEGDLIGRIKVPRLGVSALVLEGVGGRTLRRGVGHIPDTAFPGGPGNVGIAGHRDSFFRGLKDIQEDDLIEVTTPEGVHRYRVEWTRIVRPNDVQVLDGSGGPELTLVTCYPFYYVGSAPKRFIVRAVRVDGPDLWDSGARKEGP
jgi:LPXTG-site transpeptidase (sortase) family protein